MPHALHDTLKTLPDPHAHLQYYSLPALETAGIGPISRLPVSIRLVLESVLRNCDGKKGHRRTCAAVGKLEAHGPSR